MKYNEDDNKIGIVKVISMKNTVDNLSKSKVILMCGPAGAGKSTLASLIMQNIDIVLDYSFWSREMRNEYISLLKKYDIEPKIYYIKTPKEVCMERIRKRNGNHQNDIILTEQTASTYYDHFQPPTDEDGEVIVVEGY